VRSVSYLPNWETWSAPRRVEKLASASESSRRGPSRCTRRFSTRLGADQVSTLSTLVPPLAESHMISRKKIGSLDGAMLLKLSAVLHFSCALCTAFWHTFHTFLRPCPGAHAKKLYFQKPTRQSCAKYFDVTCCKNACRQDAGRSSYPLTPHPGYGPFCYGLSHGPRGDHPRWTSILTFQRAS